MKKWILILGLVIMAISAIAASRIRNTGINLDDYFTVNSNELTFDSIGNADLHYNEGLMNNSELMIQQRYFELIVQDSNLMYTNDIYSDQNGLTFIYSTLGPTLIENKTNFVISHDKYTFTKRSGIGNAFACFDENGNIFRSDTPCVGG